jgi:hypothetical protein
VKYRVEGFRTGRRTGLDIILQQGRYLFDGGDQLIKGRYDSVADIEYALRSRLHRGRQVDGTADIVGIDIFVAHCFRAGNGGGRAF